MQYPVGTIIQASDRNYIVSPSGAWRVLDYDALPDVPQAEPGLNPAEQGKDSIGE